MPIEHIQSNTAPAPVGCYSQGIRAGNFVYTSGQIPLDPQTGQLVTDSAPAAAEQTFKNLLAVLSGAGASADQVVAVTLYLADINDFGEINDVYARHFGTARPARSLIEAAALPKNARIMASAVAYTGT
jgi:2-iminobutanoate/2-iminopropanoate deaminase